jgi:hypothetical protein
VRYNSGGEKSIKIETTEDSALDQYPINPSHLDDIW